MFLGGYATDELAATAPGAKPDPDAKPPKKETITVAGSEWDCLVVEAGGSTTWVPMKNDLSTFPMFIKTEKDGKVTNTLTKIE